MSVDNKIVSITFDNAAFSQRIQDTIGALEKLRGSLNLSGAAKGLSEIGAAAKNMDMAPMAASIDGVSAKFAALATVGITAIANLTNRIIDAGIQLGKAFTLDPMLQGFGEFELKMGSIQTIMAGSGESMERVNEKLNELNTYADRTIYSFSDMTSNIGKFTNAGVGLDQAVGSIQGVANVAALAGANSEEASRAMYNFAQALSTGSVKLIDWKSIELANMGTVEFKQQIMDTAVAMGTLTKAADGTYKTMKGTAVSTKNFNTTLNEAWFTSEVLTDTLNKFSDETTDIGKRAAQAATEIKTFSQMVDTMKEAVGSGWAMTFENIFGNFEEGKGLWSMINMAFEGVVGASAEARNQMLSDWRELGGRNELVQGVAHLYQAVKSYVVPIRNAFREIFPKTTAKELYNASVAFKNFAISIMASGDTAGRVKGFFKGLFGIISIGWEIVKGVARVFFALVGAVWEVVTPLLRLASASGALGQGLHFILVQSGAIRTFFDILVKVIQTVGDVLGAVVSFVVDFILQLGMVTKLFIPFKALGGLIVDFISGFGLFGKATSAVGSLGGSITGFIEKLDILGKTTRFLDKLASRITAFVSGFDAVAAGEAAMSKTIKTFGNAKDAVWGFFSGINFDPFLNAMSQLGSLAKGAFGAFVDTLIIAGKAIWEFVSNISFAPVLSGLTIAINKAGDALDSFFGLFGGGSSGGKDIEKGAGSIARISHTIDRTNTSAEKGVSIFERLKNAIGTFFSGAFEGGGNIFDSIAKGLAGLGTGIVEAVGGAFSGANLDSILNILKTGALGGILFYIVRFFREGFGLGFLRQIKKGVKDALDALTGSLKALQTNIKADTLRKIAIALGILALAMVGLSLIDPAALAQGLLGVVSGLASLTVVMVALDKLVNQMGAGKVAAMGFAFVAMAFAMNLMASAVFLFSKMSYEDIGRGLVGVGGAMAIMAGAMRLIGDDTSGLIQAGIAMGIMGLSLMVLAKTIERFAAMDIQTIGEGLAYMAVALAGIVFALRFMPKDVVDKAAGLFILAFALKQLLKTIKVFADIEWGILSKGIFSIAIALGLIGGSMRAFPKDMMKQALALGVVAIGLNLIALAVKEVGAMKIDQIIAAVGGLSVVLLALAIAMSYFDQFKGGLAPLLGAAAALYILGQTVKTVGSMPFGDVVKGVGAIVLALAAVGAVGYFVAGPLTALGVAFGLLGIGLLAAGVGALAFAHAFQIASSVGQKGLDTMMEGLRGFIRQLPSLVTAFVQGLVDGFVEIGKRAPEIVDVLEALFMALLDAAERVLPKIVKVIGTFIEAILDEIEDKSDDVVDAGFALLVALLEGIENNIGDIVETVGNIVEEFLNALEEEAPDIIEAVFNLFVTIIQEVAYRLGETIPRLSIGVGRSFLQGFWDGITEELGKVGEFLGSVARTIIDKFKELFGINSPSKVMTDIGGDILRGLFNGIVAGATTVIDFFLELPGKILGALGKLGSFLLDSGSQLIGGLWNGITSAFKTVTNFFSSLGSTAANAIGSVLTALVNKGKELLTGLRKGIWERWDNIREWLNKLKQKAINALGAPFKWLYEVGLAIIQGLIDGLKDAWKGVTSWFNDRKDDVLRIFDADFKIGSPSKVMAERGRLVMEGFRLGLFDVWGNINKDTNKQTNTLINSIKKTALALGSSLDDMGDFHPTITPVLDLSRVSSEATRINSLLGSSIVGISSAERARDIVARTRQPSNNDSLDSNLTPREIKFEQHIHAPEALSTNDIYRNTKSQIALAKEELNII